MTESIKWREEFIVGLKMFYYPAENIHKENINRKTHIKNITTLCILRDFYKQFLYSQIEGHFFKDLAMLDITSLRPLDITKNISTSILFWAYEHLPTEEIVLVPSSGAGVNSYWSNPESAILAKFIFS